MGEFDLIVSQQPQWIQIWMKILTLGAFILPFALLIWRQSRLVAVVTVVGTVLAALGVKFIFTQMGYVRLMGLGHIPFWTPLAIYLWFQQARADMPTPPRWIIRFALLTIVISLAFDYVDVIRYLLGERTPVPVPA